ncbi:MAG: DUF1360 domain-containing protein [Actinomycetota bacterium]|nr:DUF1360 domain-containing protein [Actinomycetota bacterium]
MTDDADEYGQDEDDRPLRGYAILMAIYGTAIGGLGLLARKRRAVPQLGLGDLALVAVATHKLSRVVTKGSITSPLRAPFVRYVEPAGAGEVNEQVRVGGAAHALGELLMCPLCLDVWVATGFVAGYAFAPRATRSAASVLAVAAASNALHFGWDAFKKVDE